MNILIKEVFGTTEGGKDLLSLLKKFYIESPVYDLSRDAAFAAYREGQNDVIRYFTNCINQKES